MPLDGIDTPLEAFHRFLVVLCTMPKPLGYGPGRNRFNMTNEHLRLFRHAVLDLNYAVHGCSDEAVYEAYHHLFAVLHLMPEPLGYADHQSKEKIQAYRYELATADFPLDARPTPRSSRS
jgi:hypothetical protein